MKTAKKTLRNTGYFVFLFFMLCSFSYEDKKNKEGDVKIKEAFQKLEEAVKQRKFSDAKEVVNEIIPWMKQDIKDDKKTLTQIGKSIDESEVDKKSFSTTLGKKNKLYESTKHLVESSPAAIRVKGNDLVKLVNEYMLLIE
ncbi:hypothetical protein [Reichenbachiella sp. MALMAid0571]|uniref:hypothetical protein n=1 Tax=Reichenbachiella sp. MALMAid0571 TaxID=3143939 RepID=UPI0032DEE060